MDEEQENIFSAAEYRRTLQIGCTLQSLGSTVTTLLTLYE